MEGRELACGADDAGRTLERVVRRAFPGLPLSLIHKLLRKGAIRVNGKRAARDHLLAEGDLVRIPFAALPSGATASVGAPPAGVRAAPPPVRAKGSRAARLPPRADAAPGARRAAGDRRDGRGDPIAPTVILETAHMIALDKPRGVLSHGAGGADEFVRDYLAGRTAPSLSFRPAPMHRLDRNTTGILLCSKTLAGARALAALFASGRAEKRYLALVRGAFAGEEVWEDGLLRDGRTRITKVAPGGVPAVARVRGLASANGLSLLSLEPVTGRTHQLRAQCAHRGHPLAGDAKYGGGSGGYFLHAERVLIPPPESELLGAGVIRAPLFPEQEIRILRALDLDRATFREILEEYPRG